MDNEGNLPVFSGTYGSIFFYRYFLLSGVAMGSTRFYEVRRAFIFQVSVYLGKERTMKKGKNQGCRDYN